jgi:hypothetical protein
MINGTRECALFVGVEPEACQTLNSDIWLTGELSSGLSPRIEQPYQIVTEGTNSA